MRADGLKPSVLVLNSLINAFGEDRRDAEAFSVLQYMKENVSYCPKHYFTNLLSLFLVYTHSLFFHLMDIHLMLQFSGLEARCCYIYYTHESSNSG